MSHEFYPLILFSLQIFALVRCWLGKFSPGSAPCSLLCCGTVKPVSTHQPINQAPLSIYNYQNHNLYIYTVESENVLPLIVGKFKKSRQIYTVYNLKQLCMLGFIMSWIHLHEKSLSLSLALICSVKFPKAKSRAYVYEFDQLYSVFVKQKDCSMVHVDLFQNCQRA